MVIPVHRKSLHLWKTLFLHSLFGLMLIMAIYFFKERLYADSAYYIFHTIDSGSFVTANQRIVLAISEIISLAVYYSGANLHTILLTWSVSHVLFYYLLFIIVYHIHKNEAAGVAIILLQVIGQVWLYYSPMLEICYGAALLVVFAVLLDEKKFTVSRWFWLIVLEILVLTSHPENFVLFFFVIVADIISNGFRKKIHITFFVLLIICIIFKSMTFSEYEGGKLGYMLNLDQNHQYENLWNKHYMGDVFGIFFSHYKVLFVFLLLSTVTMILRRRWMMLLLLYFCAGGLIVLINATNYAREFTRYNESLYYPIVGLMTLAFISEFYILLPRITKTVVFICIILISVSQLNIIKINGEYLKLRTMQLEEMVHVSESAGLKKSLVRLENVEKDRWVLNWSYPMETLLISSLEGPSQTVSLVDDEDFDYRDTSIALTPDRFILRRWEIRDNSNLLPFFNMKYGDYVSLNNADSAVTKESVAGKLSIALNDEKPLEAYSKIFIPVEILNSTGKKIPSLPIDANYFLVQVSNGEQLSSSQIPFDVDITDHYTEIVGCALNGIRKPIKISVKMMIGNLEIAAAEATIN
jgi:hypothetical protein